ncbi:MAG TPA: toll/interleukin-1 receptor domain-containing protein [Bacteroidia bacterium]|nr:toll/interleukin-1 receptor domain-containing protein [Bacteroidia bacterium]
MAFNYSCFISYRHGKYELIKRFVDDLKDALSAELEPYFGQMEIYIDSERLEPGHLYNKKLSAALCQSVCMIIVYTPQYFMEDKAYCTREFMAMEDLETRRISLLEPEHQSNGLIIPIVLRGGNTVPPLITGNRIFKSFENFTLAEERLIQNRNFIAAIGEIASYIHERYKHLRKVENTACGGCDDFEIPEEETAVNWLKEHVEFLAPKFPFRNG